MAKNKKYNVDKIRRTHARAYEPWTVEEDEKLRRFAHLPVSELAAMFGRKRGAIRGRLKKLAEQNAASSQAAGATVEQQPAPAVEPAAAERADPQQPPNPAAAPMANLTRIKGLVLGAFAAGLLIGFAVGYVAGVGRSSRPAVAGPGSDPPPPSQRVQKAAGQREECLCVATWNIRGYPERLEEDTAWFHEQLQKLGAEVLCIQEVANSQRLADLLTSEASFSHYVFADSGSGRDNAILAARDVVLEGLNGPDGFQHPVQAAFVAYDGFDAVVVTVHLTWEPASRRLDEMRFLEPLVRDMLKIDPDVMLVGDFNLRPEEARSLAARLGLSVLMGRNQSTVGTLYSGNSYDYFLISPDLAAEEAQGATVVVFEGADLEIARRVSDHMPLLAFFACDERFRDRPAGENANE